MKNSHEIIQTNGLRVSGDGYVRMSADELRDLPLTHLFSGLDEDVVGCVCQDGTRALISGYTEWLSLASPVVTVGWDWRLDDALGEVRYVMDGWPRTNAMLVEARTHKDLGEETTARALVNRVQQIDWAREIAEQIADMRNGAGHWCERH
ncbi:MAG: DUF4902 domain-containing protein [Gammaproteobacteria bacterium]|nr:DUF4902 domain-containing protein [Gammaproteobacteria bacterium]